LFDECAREQAKSAAQIAGLNKIWIIRRIKAITAAANRR
jgi:hypothetical protein